VVRMMSALIVAAFLTFLPGSLIAQQPQGQPTQVPPPTQTPPTVAAPKTPPAPQPPVSRPPAEQQPAPTPTPTETPVNPSTSLPSIDPDRKTALVLLDRIDKLIEEALQDQSGKKSKSGAVGTSGSLEEKAGKVIVDRATLDEILAHVAQIKMMLQR
jgi:cytoskeletal protein RodZ